METKRCSKCKQFKDVSEFYPAKTKFGNPTLNSGCKDCLKEIARVQNLKKRNSRPKRVIEDIPGEVWVPVKGYEDKYRVSNLGRVKSLDRWVYRKIVDKNVFIEGKLLAQSMHPQEQYHMVTLYGKTTKDKYPVAVYLLVFFSFHPEIEKKPGYHVDHIDQNRTNSQLANLQYITQRENFIKRSIHNKRTSKLPGVSYDRNKGKWQTGIRYKGGKYALGRYDTELEAARAYQAALDKIAKGLHPKHPDTPSLEL